jgi:predicted metal-dependent hydrolase
MLVRKVELDFTDAKIRWADDQPEFCHLLNATSSFLHHLWPDPVNWSTADESRFQCDGRLSRV